MTPAFVVALMHRDQSGQPALITLLKVSEERPIPYQNASINRGNPEASLS
jgi:hypothetical protein